MRVRVDVAFGSCCSARFCTLFCPCSERHPKSAVFQRKQFFLEGSTALKPSETESNNRSVMPLDALGRTRATMPGTAGLFPAPRGAGNPLKALQTMA